MFNKSQIMKRAHQSANIRTALGNVFGKTTYAVEFAKALKEQWAAEKRYIAHAQKKQAERKAFAAKPIQRKPRKTLSVVKAPMSVDSLAQLLTDGRVTDWHKQEAARQLGV